MRTAYLVDDDRLAIDRYWSKRQLFMDSGFQICGAQTNPLTALEEIHALRPDVVISDLKMPELSGIGLYEELQRELFKPLFAIVSAYSDYKDIRKLFLTHGFDYLVKPVADCDLVDLLNRMSNKLNCAAPMVERLTPSKRLDEIIGYLREFSHLNHTTHSIGERFSLTPGGVCNLFSRHLDTTFSAFMNALRMERAESLLLTTYKPVKEISVLCGYSDAVYFARVFNKIHGMSPTRFREESGRSPEKGGGCQEAGYEE